MAERWEPIIAFGFAGLSLGILDGSQWAVGDADEQVAITTRTAVRALPVLELDPEESLRLISERLRQIERVPPIDTVLATLIADAVSHGRSYWTDLGMRWVEALQPTPALVEIAAQVSSSSWASQRARHAARRVIRRAERP
ncbi:hypothetical protein [Sandaracinus amylolyticus]|uniref:hypothetical protein n=1 Tax=Sandaracinus amylolyticus TaxID=927083 RepID=UPI001F3F47EE|nr:hypothetical protein [Sandaracinus amylolyticus]